MTTTPALKTGDEEDPAENPFLAIPALKDFSLSRVRVVFCRSSSLRQPSTQVLELWYYARGSQTKDGWKSLQASKITMTYTGYPEAAALAAQVRHSVFPLDDGAMWCDDWMAQQQTRLGAAAHVVCLVLTKANEAVNLLSTSPAVPTGAGPSLSDLLCKEIATPLSHVLPVLPAECSTLCRKRWQHSATAFFYWRGKGRWQ